VSTREYNFDLPSNESERQVRSYQRLLQHFFSIFMILRNRKDCSLEAACVEAGAAPQ
jgi:hypothetical protein